MRELYLNAVYSDKPIITDNEGNHYSVEAAKRYWNALHRDGVKVDCNVAFTRLVQHNFDLEAVKTFYVEEKLQRELGHGI